MMHTFIIVKNKRLREYPFNIKYEVKYATSKKFKKKDTVTKNVKKTSISLSKLKKNKKYYVKIRAYKVVKGKKIYGSYSIIKTIKKK